MPETYQNQNETRVEDENSTDGQVIAIENADTEKDAKDILDSPAANKKAVPILKPDGSFEEFLLLNPNKPTIEEIQEIYKRKVEMIKESGLKNQDWFPSSPQEVREIINRAAEESHVQKRIQLGPDNEPTEGDDTVKIRRADEHPMIGLTRDIQRKQLANKAKQIIQDPLKYYTKGYIRKTWFDLAGGVGGWFGGEAVLRKAKWIPGAKKILPKTPKLTELVQKSKRLREAKKFMTSNFLIKHRGGIIGSGLGAATGGEGYRIATHIYQDLKQMQEFQIPIPAHIEATMVDMANEIMFSAGAVGVARMWQHLRPRTVGAALGLRNEQSRQVTKWAKAIGYDIKPVEASSFGWVKGSSKVIGIFPIINRPWKKGVEQSTSDIFKIYRGELDKMAKHPAFNNKLNETFNIYSPTYTIAELGGQWSKVVANSSSAHRSTVASLYKGFEDYVTNVVGKDAQFIPTKNLTQVIKKHDSWLKSGRMKTGTQDYAEALPRVPGTGSFGEFEDFLSQYARALKDGNKYISIAQFRQLQVDLNAAIGRFADSGGKSMAKADSAIIRDMKWAIERDLNEITAKKFKDILPKNINSEAADEAINLLRLANEENARMVALSQTKGAKTIERLELGAVSGLSPGMMTKEGGTQVVAYRSHLEELVRTGGKGSKEAREELTKLKRGGKAILSITPENRDIIFKSIFNSNDPGVIKDFRTLVGQKEFARGTQKWFQDAFENGIELGEKSKYKWKEDIPGLIPKGGTLKHPGIRDIQKLSPKKTIVNSTGHGGSGRTQIEEVFNPTDIVINAEAVMAKLSGPSGLSKAALFMDLSMSPKGAAEAKRRMDAVLEIMKVANSYTIRDPSTFVSRRLTLAGAKGSFVGKSLLGMGTATAAGAAAGAGARPGMGGAAVLATTAFFFGKLLNNPKAIKGLQEVIEMMPKNARKAYIRWRAVGALLGIPRGEEEYERQERSKIMIDYFSHPEKYDFEFPADDLSGMKTIKEYEKEIGHVGRRQQMREIGGLKRGAREGLEEFQKEILPSPDTTVGQTSPVDLGRNIKFGGGQLKYGQVFRDEGDVVRGEDIVAQRQNQRPVGMARGGITEGIALATPAADIYGKIFENTAAQNILGRFAGTPGQGKVKDILLNPSHYIADPRPEGQVKLSTLYDQGKWTGTGPEPKGVSAPEGQEAWFTPAKPTPLRDQYDPHTGAWRGTGAPPHIDPYGGGRATQTYYGPGKVTYEFESGVDVYKQDPSKYKIQNLQEGGILSTRSAKQMVA